MYKHIYYTCVYYINMHINTSYTNRLVHTEHIIHSEHTHKLLCKHLILFCKYNSRRHLEVNTRLFCVTLCLIARKSYNGPKCRKHRESLKS